MSVKRFAITLIISSATLLLSCSQGNRFIQSTDRIISFDNDNPAPVPVVISKPEVIPMVSPNQNVRPEGTKISAIILHHTASAGTATAVGKFFATPEAGVSAHYTIDRTGYIIQSVEDSFRAWHAGKSEFNGVSNVNNFSIGIEICNVGNSIEPYPDTQYESIIRLVAFLAQTYEVPLTNITRHRDIAMPPGRKIDTSDNFDVKRVMDGVTAMLNGTYTPPVPVTPPAVVIPDFQQIKVKTGENSFKDIADIYLDAENRWKELKIVNPHIKNPDSIPNGTKVKIPTSFVYFYQANKL
jgi:hypothetical protein